jgi:NAD(P)-dependent dehydrogenase (short-subunit alcohol dehydrogenase family)
VGFDLAGAVEKVSRQEIQPTLDTGFFGGFNVIRATRLRFRANRSGHIGNFISASGIHWQGGAWPLQRLDVRCGRNVGSGEPEACRARISCIESLSSGSIKKSTATIYSYADTAGDVLSHISLRSGS